MAGASLPYLLAHDLGTTGNKVTLFDAERGVVVASTFEPYPTFYPQAGWAEQDPADWRRAISEATRRILASAGIEPGAIAAISFSGHMQGAVLVDAAGDPVGRAIIWADQRATAQTDQIGSVCDAATVYRLTGQRLSPTYTAPKVLWIKDHLPGVYARTGKVLQAKDYAAFLLTGAFATDYSDASSTLLYDLTRRRWAVDLMADLGLSREFFPEVVPSTTVVGRVTPAAAAATGLAAGTPVVIGGGDGACATVGACSVREGEAYAYVGSSSWIAVTTRQPILDPQQRTFTLAHLMPDFCFSLGTMQSAGGSYAWLERLLNPSGNGPNLAALDELAGGVPVGSGGLMFLPYLVGERSPYWDPGARGAFVGLAMPHGQAEIARAVLEGVALNLRLILDALRAQEVKIDGLRLIGGGARSSVWRQIISDALELPVWLPEMTAEATALGAVIAGGIGVGLFPDFGVVDKLIPLRAAESPDPSRSWYYAALLEPFRQAYTALKPVCAELTSLATRRPAPKTSGSL